MGNNQTTYVRLPATENETENVEVENPEKKANLFSRLTFYYLNDLMALGYQRPLQMEDLWKFEDNNHIQNLFQQTKHIHGRLERSFINVKIAGLQPAPNIFQMATQQIAL